jgi:hypothetical protein
MRELLLDFKGENADTFFIFGSKQSTEFANILHIINAAAKNSKATRERESDICIPSFSKNHCATIYGAQQQREITK